MVTDRNAVVIEDDADVRNLLMAILHEAGFTCTAAASGLEGIDAVDPALTLKGLAILHAEVVGGERLKLGLS